MSDKPTTWIQVEVITNPGDPVFHFSKHGWLGQRVTEEWRNGRKLVRVWRKVER